MRFRGTLLLSGKTATGFEVPADIVARLGPGKKPAVTVTLNGGYTYRSSVGSMGGKFMLPVSGEHRTRRSRCRVGRGSCRQGVFRRAVL